MLCEGAWTTTGWRESRGLLAQPELLRAPVARAPPLSAAAVFGETLAREVAITLVLLFGSPLLSSLQARPAPRAEEPASINVHFLLCNPPCFSTQNIYVKLFRTFPKSAPERTQLCWAATTQDKGREPATTMRATMTASPASGVRPRPRIADPLPHAPRTRGTAARRSARAPHAPRSRRVPPCPRAAGPRTDASTGSRRAPRPLPRIGLLAVKPLRNGSSSRRSSSLSA